MCAEGKDPTTAIPKRLGGSTPGEGRGFNNLVAKATCLSPGHIAFVLSTAKLELTKSQLRRFSFTTRGELAVGFLEWHHPTILDDPWRNLSTQVLHRCVDLPQGCLYGSAWEKVRLLRQAPSFFFFDSCSTCNIPLTMLIVT